MMEKIEWSLPHKYIDSRDRRQGYTTSPDYYSWYYTYGYRLQPESVLEIGVRLGYSLIALCHGARDSGWEVNLVRGIDSEIATQNSNQRAMSNIKRDEFADLDIQLKSLDSSEVGPDTFGRKFELVHVDANHDVGFGAEIRAAWECVELGGWMVVDDCGSRHCARLRHRVPQMRMVNDAVSDMIFDGTAESATWIQSLTGHMIVKKKEEQPSF